MCIQEKSSLLKIFVSEIFHLAHLTANTLEKGKPQEEEPPPYTDTLGGSNFHHHCTKSSRNPEFLKVFRTETSINIYINMDDWLYKGPH